MLKTVDSLELATNVELLGGGKEVLDTGVSVIVAAKDLLGLVDPAMPCKYDGTVCAIETTYLSGR